MAGLKKRLLVRESEFASVLKMFAREGNTLSAVLRQAWDGDTLGALTKRFAERASGAHISVVGHITAPELLRHLSQTEAANGLGNRFLWFATRRSKLLPDGGKLSAVDFAPLKPRLQQVMDFLESLDPAHPLELMRDAPARALWHEAYPRLSQGRLGITGALTARAEAQTMRLACIYALLDCSCVIREEHLRAALALWEYAEASVRAIFGEQLGDPLAERLLTALRATPDGLGRDALMNAMGRNLAAAEIGHALSVLRSRGLARMERIATRGRTREHWYVTSPQPPLAERRHTGT